MTRIEELLDLLSEIPEPSHPDWWMVVREIACDPADIVAVAKLAEPELREIRKHMEAALSYCYRPGPTKPLCLDCTGAGFVISVGDGPDWHAPDCAIGKAERFLRGGES